MRSPYSGYPGDGLNPRRLATILREADLGDPIRYFELAETIEERDAHYTGILATRKRSVAQLEIHVVAADATPQAKADADMITAWLTRDALTGELFDMLDAIGKGMSFTEIVWDTSEGQWTPLRLERRDQRWFRPDIRDGVTPMLRIDTGDVTFAAGDPLSNPNGFGYAPLPPFKFIHAVIRAKSGLPVRSGIARLAAWSWMFKAYTLRDWAIFTQTFGQPVRVGQYPPGSSEADKDTLFRAVANIAGDCAAIIPESMKIEFVEAANVGTGTTLYKDRADWFDQQMSKAVLGQTATTDAIAGGHAVGKEHRAVQEDIERSDAKALSAIINRDLVVPWIQLERGPQSKYPSIHIGRAEDIDVELTVNSVVQLVPMGLKIGAKLFQRPARHPDSRSRRRALWSRPRRARSRCRRMCFRSNRSTRRLPCCTRCTIRSRSARRLRRQTLRPRQRDALVNQVKAVVDRCTSLQQVRDELKKIKPGAAEAQMAGLMRMARAIANMTGRAAVTDA